MSVSAAECVNRYRAARRAADLILTAHSDVAYERPASVIVADFGDAEWRLAAGRVPSEATKALIVELLREHGTRQKEVHS